MTTSPTWYSFSLEKTPPFLHLGQNGVLTDLYDGSTLCLMSTRNITKAFRLSTEQDRIDGQRWYRLAREFAATLDSDVSRAAGIIAALSPLQSWPTNKKMAAEFYAGRRDVHTRNNVAKGERILAGENPLDVLGGLKVRAFYCNIMGMDNDESVTIDRHAIAVCEGRPIKDSELKVYFTKTRNRQYVEEYRRAAKILSKELQSPISASEVQATVWVWWRRNHAINKHGD